MMGKPHDYLIALLEKVEADLLTASSVARELVRDKCLPPYMSTYIGRIAADSITVRRAIVAQSKESAS